MLAISRLRAHDDAARAMAQKTTLYRTCLHGLSGALVACLMLASLPIVPEANPPDERQDPFGTQWPLTALFDVLGVSSLQCDVTWRRHKALPHSTGLHRWLNFEIQRSTLSDTYQPASRTRRTLVAIRRPIRLGWLRC